MVSAFASYVRWVILNEGGFTKSSTYLEPKRYPSRLNSKCTCALCSLDALIAKVPVCLPSLELDAIQPASEGQS